MQPSPTSALVPSAADIELYKQILLSTKVAHGASNQLIDAANQHLNQVKEDQASIASGETEIDKATQQGQADANSAQHWSWASAVKGVTDGTMKLAEKAPDMLLVTGGYAVAKAAVAMATSRCHS